MIHAVIEKAERMPEATPARIAPLANLPLFHRLAGRKVVVHGASDGALWKAELLAAAGAEVLHLAEGWSDDDFADAALVVGSPEDRDEAERMIAAAHRAGVLVNMIDQTEYCDVTFGTIVNRSPVIVAISTDGAAPMLGQSIRARVESVLPLSIAAWGRAAKAWREPLKERVTSFQSRRGFWERFVERAWANAAREPTDHDRDTLFAAQPEGHEGRVTLVGAGPGDPELLTLKAVRALQTATVILYDDLVGPDILELARREATRIAVGKAGRGPSCKQVDINAQMIALAQSGERVVRLKGGDPLVFGRATEEIEACKAAGIPVSIVPGISAAQGAAAALGFSLTERTHARRIQFVTGHGADGKLPTDIHWPAIADPAATTIVYMPRATLAEFSERAIGAGLDADTPAVAIASATLTGQEQVAGTIATIDALADTLSPGRPVTVIIGKVTRDTVAVIAPLDRIGSVA